MSADLSLSPPPDDSLGVLTAPRRLCARRGSCASIPQRSRPSPRAGPPRHGPSRPGSMRCTSPTTPSARRTGCCCSTRSTSVSGPCLAHRVGRSRGAGRRWNDTPRWPPPSPAPSKKDAHCGTPPISPISTPTSWRRSCVPSTAPRRSPSSTIASPTLARPGASAGPLRRPVRPRRRVRERQRRAARPAPRPRLLILRRRGRVAGVARAVPQARADLRR